MMDVKRLGALATVALSLVAAASVTQSAQAQDKYPSRNITIVVPFGAGSSSDVFTRRLATKLEASLGQKIVVENRAGANGLIGAGHVARSKPDGYTVLYGGSAALASAPLLVKSPPFDAAKDFAGVTAVGEQVFVLLTRVEFKDVPFPEFLERMRRNPEQFPIGGQAVSTEILNKLLSDAGKLKHTFVPYSDYGRMISDLYGGRLGAVVVVLNLGLNNAQEGQGHIMAVGSKERLAVLPNTPTLLEVLPGVGDTTLSWSGFFVPAGTPQAAIDRLYGVITEAGKDPEIRKHNEEGGRALAMSPSETDAFLKSEIARWGMLLKSIGKDPQ